MDSFSFRQMESTLYDLKHELESQRVKTEGLTHDKSDLEDQVQYWQARHDELQQEHQDLSIEHDKLMNQLQADDQEKQTENRQVHSLRLIISELESTKMVMEKEF